MNRIEIKFTEIDVAEVAMPFFPVLFKYTARYFGMKITKSFIDNVLREKVIPVQGSVVYCKLAVEIEHSGIYIGNNKIVHLDGCGEIKAVSPKQFLKRLDGLNPAITIYVSCNGVKPAGKKDVAERAKKMIGKKIDYGVTRNNCHRFTSGCLTGNFNNNDQFFFKLEKRVKEVLNSNNWRAWKREKKE